MNCVKWFRRLRRDPSCTQRTIRRFVIEDSMDHDEIVEAALENEKMFLNRGFWKIRDP